MNYRQQLRETWQEFVTTIGMLYTTKTGEPAPDDPVVLIEQAKLVGVLPTDAVPLLRRASQEFANLARLFDETAAYEQHRSVMLEMFSATAWAGSRIIHTAFEQAGFTVWEAEDVPLSWTDRPPGFFAQRRTLTFFVSPLYTRAEPSKPVSLQTLSVLLNSAYATMSQAAGFADRLPTPVIVHTGRPVVEPSHAFVRSNHHSIHSYHEFMVPLGQLSLLGQTIKATFDAEG